MSGGCDTMQPLVPGEEVKAGDQILLPHCSVVDVAACLGSAWGRKQKNPLSEGDQGFWVVEFHPNLHTGFALVEPFVQRHRLA